MTLAQTLGELVCPPSGAPGTAAGDLAHLPCVDPVVGVPTNTVAPVASVSAGVATVTNGTWTGTPTSYLYQWQRDGINIAGALASSYLVASRDHGMALGCVVVATNATGNSVPVASNTVSV